ncbi:MAG: signal peptidase II [Candidatus Omnitrophota bacterium]|jgi:signal peptidase II
MPSIIVFIILFLDQLTKFLASKKLELNNPVPVIKGVFNLTLVHNRGAAFGIFKNQFYLFIFSSIIAVILIYSILKKNRRNNFYSFSLSLILGGALGNLIDRAFLGYVVDFLDFRIWPVFNLADSAITIGALSLGWLIFKSEKKNAS